MRVITLGTSAAMPTLRRSSSATAVEFEGEVLLFDCGEGTQTQLMRSPLRWGKIRNIFISHLHGDHFYGLPGLLDSFSLSGREDPIEVFGPPGIKAYLETLKNISGHWVSYPLTIREIFKEGVIFDGDRYQVSCARLSHGAECWGFLFREKDRPGIFDEAKARELEIPEGPLRRELVLGKDVVLDDGRKLKSSEWIGPPRPGRTLAYCIDTKPCPGVMTLAKGVDFLIHEATFEGGREEEAHSLGHSTALDAAKAASAARVGQLVMTHISGRYTDTSTLTDQARGVFVDAVVASDGQIFYLAPKEA